MRNTRVLFRCLLLLAFLPLLAASPARGNNCPVFSWPNQRDTIKVTYGNCPLVPATATITTPGYSGDPSQWEIVALYPFNPASCPADIVPMPAWISFEPSSGPSAPALSVKMTIDPTKGGGSVTLGMFRSDLAPCAGQGILGVDFPGGAVAPNWLDQNGIEFIHDGPNGTFAYGFGTWIVTADTPFVSPSNTSLDLGPSCPRSGGEAMCGSPINLTNGNTFVQADDYELPGLGGGISLKRTWNSEWANNSPWIQAGMFGDSWQSTFEKRIQVLSGGTQLRYWRGDGSAWLFTNNKGWTLTSPPDERATLASSHSGYTITLRDGSQEQYNSNGLPTVFLDRNGNQTTLTYDASSRLISVKDAASRLLQFTYDPVFVQQVTKIQDATGTIATYTYDSGSHLTSATYADNSVVNYSYDSNGLLLSVTDQLSKVLEAHTYDTQRRGLSSQRANGVDSLTLTYSPGGSYATLTDSAANQTIYDAGDNFGSRRYPTNIRGTGCDSCLGRNNQSFSYDTSGNRISSVDPNGNQATYSYDSNGNVTQISRSVGSGTQTSNFTWNSFGEVLTATDPLGKVTTNTYDTKGNLLTTKTPLGNTTTFTYDTKGELLTIKDPRLNITTLTYTAAGLIASIKDAQNHLTQFQYDTRGNRTAVIDALNQTTSFTYDTRNRLTKITYPTSPATTTQFAYDYRGRRTSVTDANGKITQYIYDDADRLNSITDANNQVTSYAYDTENNLMSITDAATNKTSFTYDALGRVTQTLFPSNLTESYVYDTNGNLTSKTDRKSQVINYAYDAANRLTSKTYPDTTSVSYTYDLANHLTQVVDPTGTYGFTFDADGRLTQTSTAYSFITNKTFTVGYGYDAAANRTSMTDPENGATSYVYDTLNRLQTLTPPSAFSGTGNFGITYDALSRRTQLTRPNSVSTNYSYDNLSRLLSVLHQAGTNTLDGATYTVDNAGNRVSRTPQPSGTATSYGYDATYQLLSAQGGTTAESYTYDLVGNRLTSAAGSYGYNTSNELTSSPTATFTYDANGNTTSKTDSTGTTNYSWDFENRLTSVTLPGSGGTVSYRYDPWGRRIEKISPTATSIFAYDGVNLVEETNASGGIVARYSQDLGVDEPLAMLRSGATSYYQVDGNDNVTSLSSTAGALAQTYTYDSFGNVTGSSGSLTNPFQYTAREWDAETRLQFSRFRYFDPGAGRFISEDPIQFYGGANFYAYTNNRPTYYVDAFGLQEGWNDYKNAGNVFTLIRAKGFANEALNAAENWAKQHQLPPGALHNGPADGFRHCFWSCTMTRYLGEAVAETIADEHEKQNNRDGQPKAEELMDRANNLAGRTAALSCPKNDKNCWNLCTDLYNQGRLFGLGGRPNHFPQH